MLKQVRSFKNLASLVYEEAKYDSDIRSRIGMVKTAFGLTRNKLVSLSTNIRTRITVLKAYMWSQ